MLEKQIQEVLSVKKGSKPPYSRLQISSKVYEVLDFKKNRVKYKGVFKWQTDRTSITILHSNVYEFPYLSQNPKPFNIKLEELERTEKYGYSEVKFYNL
jgi:hypothetical protein